MTTKRAFLKAHDIYARERLALEERNGGSFSFFARKSPVVGELFFYDVIGEDWMTDGGVSASAVQKALVELNGVETLNIFINSPGGDVFEAKAILTLLQRFSAKKIVHVDGIAASAATFIAMVGDQIITASHANWMIHEASAIAFGRSEDMRAKADVLDIQNKDMAELYAARTKKPVEEMLAMMTAETWMSAADALKHGFTDLVSEAPKEKVPEDRVRPASRLVAALETTDRTLRDVRQARRVEEFSRACSAKRDGLPSRSSK